MPIPASNRHAAYNDTPSKIPFPLSYGSPVPLDSKLASKISGLPSRGSGGSLARRMTSKSMSNLASKARGGDEADEGSGLVGCSTPARQRGIYTTQSPNRHITGRASVGSPGELERVFHDFDVTMQTASFSSPAPSLGTPFVPRPREEEAGLPPTLIPAPTYIYRPDATPAKWSLDDPDLPSPFLRRRGSSSASAVPLPNTLDAWQRPQDQRAPLSSINAQPTQPQPQPQTQAPRKLPRSKSGNLSLHARVLQHNAARTEGMGAPSRTRVKEGRDPARC